MTPPLLRSVIYLCVAVCVYQPEADLHFQFTTVPVTGRLLHQLSLHLSARTITMEAEDQPKAGVVESNVASSGLVANL